MTAKPTQPNLQPGTSGVISSSTRSTATRPSAEAAAASHRRAHQNATIARTTNAEGRTPQARGAATATIAVKTTPAKPPANEPTARNELASAFLELATSISAPNLPSGPSGHASHFLAIHPSLVATRATTARPRRNQAEREHQ